MPDKYYVYLLRDPREPDFHRSIFYIGKGTGTRALAHRADALLAAGIQDDASDADREVLRAKEDRLRDIHDAGLVETIDVLIDALNAPIAETAAFAVESALIEVLGRGQLTGLTNRVRGHRLRLRPGVALSMGHTAEAVELPAGVAAVIVPVNGVWGGLDYAGTLIEASDAEIWENSRRTWSRFSQERQRTVRNRAGTDNPVLLLALAKDPAGVQENLIVGVYALTAARESADPADREGGFRAAGGDGESRWVAEYNGWVLEREERELEISATLLHGVLTVGGAPQRRPQDRGYVGDWGSQHAATGATTAS